MNIKKLHIILIAFVALACFSFSFQAVEDVDYTCVEGKIIAKVPKSLNGAALDSLLQELGLSVLTLDSVINNGNVTSSGWKLIENSSSHFTFTKSIHDLNANAENVTSLFDVLDKEKNTIELESRFGYNKLKKPYPYDASNQTVTFKLAGYDNAREVYISGTWNNWSLSECPLTFEDGAWTARVALKPGKYMYKFIVDGEWKLDPNNKQVDWYGNHANSVYFVTNHVFHLEGFEENRRVYLAGNFNGWDKYGLPMKRASGTWFIPVYLEDGKYQYKYIIDKKWRLDPSNPKVVDDGKGNLNNELTIGKPVEITTTAFPNAEQVILCGSFNNWNESELKMNQSDNGWSSSYPLKPGNYEYKFIVNKQWKLDPNNPITIGENDYTNSVLSIDPNYTFNLKGYKNANEVIVTGSFNNWSKNGYRMVKTADGWQLNLHLDKGKVLYKFIIDGEWHHDIVNPLWEHNEFDGKNSVLWIE